MWSCRRDTKIDEQAQGDWHREGADTVTAFTSVLCTCVCVCQKTYGRPSLSGLPEEVFSPLGAFMTTIDNIRLSRVKKETHMKATDQTFGVFRNFAVARPGEERIYDKTKTLQHLKHMVRGLGGS